jgi:hypothetical protein
MLSLPHPPYSPDLAPANFFLFLKRKMQLKGRRFHAVAAWSQIHQYNNSRC